MAAGVLRPRLGFRESPPSVAADGSDLEFRWGFEQIVRKSHGRVMRVMRTDRFLGTTFVMRTKCTSRTCRR